MTWTSQSPDRHRPRRLTLGQFSFPARAVQHSHMSSTHCLHSSLHDHPANTLTAYTLGLHYPAPATTACWPAQGPCCVAPHPGSPRSAPWPGKPPTAAPAPQTSHTASTAGRSASSACTAGSCGPESRIPASCCNPETKHMRQLQSALAMQRGSSYNLQREAGARACRISGRLSNKQARARGDLPSLPLVVPSPKNPKQGGLSAPKTAWAVDCPVQFYFPCQMQYTCLPAMLMSTPQAAHARHTWQCSAACASAGCAGCGSAGRRCTPCSARALPTSAQTSACTGTNTIDRQRYAVHPCITSPAFQKPDRHCFDITTWTIMPGQSKTSHMCRPHARRPNSLLSESA